MSDNHVLLADLVSKDLKQENYAAYYALEMAKKTADRMFGKCPLCYTFTVHAIQDHINDHISDQGIILQRDTVKRQTLIKDYLLPLLRLASEHDYNFADKSVFKYLYDSATALLSDGYMPMRVLGTTTEGFNPEVLRSQRTT